MCPTKRLLQALCLALLLPLASCGYSSSMRLPGGAQSVAVAVFENSSPFPEIEREVFACMTTQASRMIEAKLVAPSRADVIIRGSIDDYRRIHGVQSTGGSLQESGVQILMHAWLEDRKSGQMIGEVLYFEELIRYIVGVRDEQAGARRNVLATLCQEIVLDLLHQPDEASGVPQAPQSPLPEDVDGLDGLED